MVHDIFEVSSVLKLNMISKKEETSPLNELLGGVEAFNSEIKINCWERRGWLAPWFAYPGKVMISQTTSPQCPILLAAAPPALRPLFIVPFPRHWLGACLNTATDKY
jgi:hypothetical protein